MNQILGDVFTDCTSYFKREKIEKAACEIPLPQFLKIGIIAKVISIVMIAFSGFLGDLCGLLRWQVIAVGLLFMLLASVVLQHFYKKGEANYHERIHIDC